VLGLVKREHIIGIAEALLNGDRAGSIARLAELFRHGMDIKRFTGELLECYRALLLIRIGGCDQLLEIPDDEMKTLRALAQSHSAESIHQQLSRLMQTAEDLRFALQPRLILETSFLAIIESGNVVGLETLLEKIDGAIGSLPDKSTPIPKPSDQPAPTGTAVLPPSAARRKKKEMTEREPPPPEEELIPETPDPPTVEDERQATAARMQPTFSLEPSAAEKKDSEPQKTSPLPKEKAEKPRQVQRDIRKDWTEFISYLKREKEWMAQTLQQTSSVREDGAELLLEFDNPNDCFVLRSKENRQQLTEYILDFFQQDLTIRIVSPDSSNDIGRKDSEGPKKRRQLLAEHHLVRMTEEIFNGRVGSIRISDPNK
jgi:DNA polymerase-3 subunit gamma/tau